MADTVKTATSAASTAAVSANPAGAILTAVSGIIQGVSGLFLGNKQLNMQLQVENWKYNIANTQLRGEFNLAGWKLLSDQTSADATTGRSVLGVLAVIVIVMLITKKR